MSTNFETKPGLEASANTKTATPTIDIDHAESPSFVLPIVENKGGQPVPAAEMGSLVHRRSRYLTLQAKFLMGMIRHRKISIRKVLNVARCYSSYFLKRTKSGKAPFVMNFELWNECNERCLFCRSSTGDIYDLNPQGKGTPIAKGKMSFEVYRDIITQVKDWLLLAIPYINGEPLISKDIFRAIQCATDNRVASMIASNGLKLNEENSEKLLEAGLDFLKVHISGFTTQVHKIEHRQGDAEKIKQNVARMAELNAKHRGGMMIILDYILYNHNKHELPLAEKFAKDHGLVFNVRPGNPHGLEGTEPPQVSGPLPIDLACVFLWTAMSVNWDGSLLPCCDYVVWSGETPYEKFESGATDVLKMWNGERVMAMRQAHVKTGRREIDICRGCPRTGIAFKF